MARGFDTGVVEAMGSLRWALLNIWNRDAVTDAVSVCRSTGGCSCSCCDLLRLEELWVEDSVRAVLAVGFVAELEEEEGIGRRLEVLLRDGLGW
jgi:hypothetical protein